MTAIQWVSAESLNERLTKEMWQKTLAAFCFTLLPLLFYLSMPFTLLLGLAIACKWIAVWRNQHLIATIAMLITFALGSGLIYLHFSVLGMTFSFVALLTVMATCKMLESRNARDIRVLFLLAMALLLCFLMYGQTFLVFLYLLFLVTINIYALAQVEQRHNTVTISLGQWKSVGKLMMIALPFAALMFFAFPRINPLWGLPQRTNQGITGLPEEMNMGDLAQLAQSNEVAFRVRFANNQIPAGDKLYWRGPVLWKFDGMNWKQRPQDFYISKEQLLVDETSAIEYDVIIEKRELSWLPLMDMAVITPERAHRGSALQTKMPTPIRGEPRFHIKSMTHYNLGANHLSNADRKDATQLPYSLTIPKTKALAEQLRAQGGGTTTGFIEAFLNHIRHNEYYYSLEPMPGAGNVEQFLFEQKIGFCEHYANAMTIAARSIGIPARVIIGYQGGDFNPMSKEWLVREENAHAWVEIWLEDTGWTRFDPTAAVAPYRIQNARLDSQSLSGADDRAFTSRLAEKYAAIAWLRNAMDASQSFWRNWVINLNSDRQGSLLGELGLSGISKTTMLVVAIIIALVFLLLLWKFWDSRARTDDDVVAHHARKLMNKLAKRGMVRKNTETVADFLRRVSTTSAAKSPEQWKAAANAYEQLRYYEQQIDSVAVANQLKRLL